MTTPADPIFAGLFAAVLAGDINAVRDCYTADAVIWHNFDDRTQTVDEHLAGLQTWLATIAEMQVEFGPSTGTVTAAVQELWWVNKLHDGTVIRYPSCMVATLRDGRIARLNEYMDPTPIAALLAARTTSPTTEPQWADHPWAQFFADAYLNIDQLLDRLSDDFVLHPATPGAAAICGKRPALEEFQRRAQLCRTRLVAFPQASFATDTFAVVFGQLTAERTDGLVLDQTVCGVWRMAGTAIVEHWECASDAPAFGRFFSMDRP